MDATIPERLVALARTLGDPRGDMAILAEGNVSGRADEATFWVKASGTSLSNLSESGLVRVGFESLREALGGGDLDDAGVRAALSGARTDTAAEVMPSVETFMHAYLLGLPEIRYVGHTHPTPLLSLLAMADAADFARLRMFPDEIVCCGPESPFVPYVDPGLPLARAIRTAVEGYVEAWGGVPKTIWLGNHGLIALGRSPSEVESASRMAVKAAQAWLGLLATGKPVRSLTRAEIERIHTRPDEHYRQRLLWQVQH